MNNETFNIFAKRVFRDCMKTLSGKNAEYMRNDNKFHNFIAAGKIRGCSAISALMGMKVKHTVSIEDIVRDYEATGKLPSLETLREKIGDEINYLVILQAMFEELIEEEKHKIENMEVKIYVDNSKLIEQLNRYIYMQGV